MISFSSTILTSLSENQDERLRRGGGPDAV